MGAFQSYLFFYVDILLDSTPINKGFEYLWMDKSVTMNHEHRFVCSVAAQWSAQRWKPRYPPSTTTTEPPPSTTTDSGRGWVRIGMSVTTVLAEAAMVSVVVVCWPGLVLQCCSAAVLHCCRDKSSHCPGRGPACNPATGRLRKCCAVKTQYLSIIISSSSGGWW